MLDAFSILKGFSLNLDLIDWLVWMDRRIQGGLSAAAYKVCNCRDVLACLTFYMSLGDLNLGSQACTVSTKTSPFTV